MTDRRRHDRKSVLADAEIRCGDDALPCEVADISVGGAKLRANGVANVGAEVELMVGKFGPFPSTIAWRSNDYYGLKFDGDETEIGEAILALATHG